MKLYLEGDHGTGVSVYFEKNFRNSYLENLYATASDRRTHFAKSVHLQKFSGS